jgi:delta 1-pyrroline-5-carboxylate dehydrogenase
MNVSYVGADASGRIQFLGIVPEGMVEIQTPPVGGSLVLGTGEIATHRIVDGAIVERPVNPAVLDGMSITGVPAGAIVTIDGTTYPEQVVDGVLELSFSEAGTHAVKLDCWPEQDATFEVQS